MNLLYIFHYLQLLERMKSAWGRYRPWRRVSTWQTPFACSLMLTFAINTVSAAGNERETNPGRVYEVFVAQSSLHTGLIFKTGNLDPGIWPEVIHYQNKTFVDIGWGDEKFFQALGFPVFLAIRAMLWPTPSTLEIFAFNTTPQAVYGPGSRVLKIAVTGDELRALSRFMANSFKRDKNGEVQLSMIHETNSRFFQATRSYHLFRTCNTWVAMAFRYAGFPVRSFGVLNANQLFRQLRRIPGAEFTR